MKKILLVDACVREESRTRGLAEYLMGKLEGEKEVIRLIDEQLQPIDGDYVNKRVELVNGRAFDHEMFRWAKQFAAADEIVVAAPYWDMSFPSILKVYIEHVEAMDVTFGYSPEGLPTGLCKAAKLYYVSTAGGAIYDGNLGFKYMTRLCQEFWGIKETKLFQAELLDVVGQDIPGILANARKEIDEYFR